MCLLDRMISIVTVVLASILCLAFSTIADEETITLTTYYPAPYGNFAELDVEDLDVDDLDVKRLAVGSAALMPTNDGDANIAGYLDVDGIVTAGRYDKGGATGQSGTFWVDGNTVEVIVTNGIVTGP